MRGSTPMSEPRRRCTIFGFVACQTRPVAVDVRPVSVRRAAAMVDTPQRGLAPVHRAVGASQVGAAPVVLAFAHAYSLFSARARRAVSSSLTSVTTARAPIRRLGARPRTRGSCAGRTSCGASCPGRAVSATIAAPPPERIHDVERRCSYRTKSTVERRASPMIEAVVAGPSGALRVRVRSSRCGGSACRAPRALSAIVEIGRRSCGRRFAIDRIAVRDHASESRPTPPSAVLAIACRQNAGCRARIGSAPSAFASVSKSSAISTKLFHSFDVVWSSRMMRPPRRLRDGDLSMIPRYGPPRKSRP